MKPACSLVALCLLLHPDATAAQGTGDATRYVTFADIAYARTWDDEGLLGAGGALTGGIGIRVTPRLTIQAIVERIGYHFDADYLSIDGRTVFAGVEAAYQSARPRVRPFCTVGIGMYDDDSDWVGRTRLDPFLPVVEDRSHHAYRLAALTGSGGLDVRVSERASIRAVLRFVGLLDTGQDLAPHTSLQPGIGVAWRW